jgi:hypothetical protein
MTQRNKSDKHGDSNFGGERAKAGAVKAADVVELRLEHDSVLELRDGVPVRRHYFPFANTKAKLRECMRELAREIARQQ